MIGDTQRLAYSIAEAAEATGIGRTSLYMLIRTNQLKSVTVGRRRLIPAAELQALLRLDQAD